MRARWASAQRGFRRAPNPLDWPAAIYLVRTRTINLRRAASLPELDVRGLINLILVVVWF